MFGKALMIEENCRIANNRKELQTLTKSVLIGTLGCKDYLASSANMWIKGSHDDIPIAPLVVFFRKSSLAEGKASNLLMKFIIVCKKLTSAVRLNLRCDDCVCL